MERTTNKQLEFLCARINAQIGNFHLSGANGGVSLHQTMTEGGGVRDVFSCGHVTKRDLYQMMRAYLAACE
jgi:hypothetical protein